MRRLQVPPAEVPAGVRVRAVLPAGPAPEIRQRPQGLRRQQRHQAPQRAPAPPARGRRQLPRLRGRHAAARPRLRLRRRHLPPPTPAPPTPNGSQLRQIRALQVSESRRHLRPWPHPPPGDQHPRRRRRPRPPLPPPALPRQPTTGHQGFRWGRQRVRREQPSRDEYVGEHRAVEWVSAIQGGGSGG